MFGWIGRRTKKMASNVARRADMPLMQRMLTFVKELLIPIYKREKGDVETFEEAVARFKLTPEDLAQRKKMFLMQMIIYLAGAICVSIYTYYLIKGGYWFSVAFAILLIIFLIVSALKSHFWIFQINQRKLGCTLREWLNASVKESN